LSLHPRRLSCRFLYDDHGSRLFDAITEQHEYYLTRSEAELLQKHAGDIRELAGPSTLVELGAGTAAKTRHLLDAWTRGGRPATYVGVDICPSVVEGAAHALRGDYPTLEVNGIAASYEQALSRLGEHSPLTLAFLGSTIGNLDEPELDGFLKRTAAGLSSRDHFLIGIDLVKDPATLEAAYNDAAGVTAAFTLNLFARMNRELGTSLDLSDIEHVAYYNARKERIDIFARFRREAVIELASLGERFRIAAGEMVQTEISRKFHREDIARRFGTHGFELRKSFVDPVRHFALLLFRLRRSESDAARQALNLLDEARARTRDLIYPLTEAQLVAQHSPLMSPIVWDLAHIANYEEQWVTRALPGIPGLGGGVPAERDDLYDAIGHPRRTRGALPLMRRARCLDYMAAVRRRTRAAIAATPGDATEPLLADGYLWSMLAQHEAQHEETVLQAIQLLDGLVYEPHLRRDPDHAASSVAPAMVTIAAGSFPIGTDDRAIAYDNERPEHVAELERFRIDLYPVSNGQFLEFVLDGGYRRRELWSDEGWSWLCEARVEHPARWIRSARGPWLERQFGRIAPLDPLRPVIHVSWFEADAYARWAGSACLPRRNGRRRRRAISRTASRGPIRGATSRPLSRARIWISAPSHPRSSARTPKAGASSDVSRCSATSGNGRRASSCPIRDSRSSPIRSTPRCTSGADIACSGAAPGRRVRSPSATPSATGTCRNAVRSSPGSAVRATTELSARRAFSPDDS
jgi:L-histidine N-alpha-methyltransferase